MYSHVFVFILYLGIEMGDLESHKLGIVLEL